jgi:5'-nucleotidase
LHVLVEEQSLLLVNVNFPRNPKGLVWTRASVRRYDGHIVPTTHPLGRELYWFTVQPIKGADVGTDRWAMEQGWGSMTPLRLDLTQEEELQQLRTRRPLDEEVAMATSPPTSSPAAAEEVLQDETSSTTPNVVKVE